MYKPDYMLEQLQKTVATEMVKMPRTRSQSAGKTMLCMESSETNTSGVAIAIKIESDLHGDMQSAAEMSAPSAAA
jgi:hypothetical protein